MAVEHAMEEKSEGDGSTAQGQKKYESKREDIAILVINPNSNKSMTESLQGPVLDLAYDKVLYEKT